MPPVLGDSCTQRPPCRTDESLLPPVQPIQVSHGSQHHSSDELIGGRANERKPRNRGWRARCFHRTLSPLLDDPPRPRLPHRHLRLLPLQRAHARDSGCHHPRANRRRAPRRQAAPAPRASRTAALVLARLTSLAVSLAVNDTVPPARRAGPRNAARPLFRPRAVLLFGRETLHVARFDLEQPLGLFVTVGFVFSSAGMPPRVRRPLVDRQPVL